MEETANTEIVDCQRARVDRTGRSVFWSWPIESFLHCPTRLPPSLDFDGLPACLLLLLPLSLCCATPSVYLAVALCQPPRPLERQAIRRRRRRRGGGGHAGSQCAITQRRARLGDQQWSRPFSILSIARDSIQRLGPRRHRR